MQGATSRLRPRSAPFKPAPVRWETAAPSVLISILKGKTPEGRLQKLPFGFKKNNQNSPCPEVLVRPAFAEIPKQKVWALTIPKLGQWGFGVVFCKICVLLFAYI